MRWFAVLALALALGVVGCSEASGTGGLAGDGGSGGVGGDGGTAGASGCGGCCGGDGGIGGLNSAIFPCTEQGILDAIAEGGGPHTFDCADGTTLVTTETLVIDNGVILDGEGRLTADGDQDHPVFAVESDVTAELRGFTVTRGSNPADAGGIVNAGTLSLTDSTVSGNHGGRNFSGNGIVSITSLTLTNSTVSGNDGDGAAIFSAGTLTMTNSTVSGNDTPGIALHNATATVTNSTVSGRIATGGNQLTLTNSVIDGDCAGFATSNGYNIESPGDTCGFDQLTDQVNVSADDVKLRPLQDNGGPTETHALGAGSVAIDVIPETECVDAEGEPLTTDQRGEPRDSMCDVGAFEVQP